MKIKKFRQKNTNPLLYRFTVSSITHLKNFNLPIMDKGRNKTGKGQQNNLMEWISYPFRLDCISPNLMFWIEILCALK